jgi:hypothetical protein
VSDSIWFWFYQQVELIDRSFTVDNTTDVHAHTSTFGQCGTSQITYNHLPTALIPTVSRNSTGDAFPSHTKRSPSIATAAPYPNALTLIPDELMTSIYSYCSRSTLLNCMLVDRRQFSLVVPIVWRSVRSPEGNLKQLRGFCSDAESHWVSFGYYSCIPTGKWLTRLNLTLNFCLEMEQACARSRIYLSAIRNYVTTSRPHFSERFHVQEELPYLSDQCPDILRVEISYGNVIRLVLHRQAGTSEWTDLELVVTDATRFMQAEDDQSYASWFSEMLWPGQPPGGRTALLGLRLVRLAVGDSMHYDQRDLGSFEYLLDWIRPYTCHLETLEIGPRACRMADDRKVDCINLLLQLRPSINKLHLCGYMQSNLVARIINTSISNLEELAFYAPLPDYPDDDPYYHDEEYSEYGPFGRVQSITDAHPALVRAIDAIDRLKRLVLYVNPEEVSSRLGLFKTETQEHAPTDRSDIFPISKSCPTSLAHSDDIVFGKDPYCPFPHQKWHDQWLKDMEEALREKRENSR